MDKTLKKKSELNELIFKLMDDINKAKFFIQKNNILTQRIERCLN